MRTTLDIDEDVLVAVKEAARLQRISAGQVVSKLLREVMTGRRESPLESDPQKPVAGGFRPFAATGKIVTNEQIDRLRDKEGV